MIQHAVFAANKELFHHMERFTSISHNHHDGSSLIPSGFPDVELSGDQDKLLNPTTQDVMLGSLMLECSGERAMKRLAKRRLDIATGNVQSYSRVLNGSANLELMKEHCELVASLAELQAEKDAKNEAAKAKKKQEEAEKARKKEEENRKELALKEELRPVNQNDVDKGIEHVLKLTNKRMVQVLKYHFGDNTPSLASKNKSILQELVRKHMEPADDSTSNHHLEHSG